MAKKSSVQGKGGCSMCAILRRAWLLFLIGLAGCAGLRGLSRSVGKFSVGKRTTSSTQLNRALASPPRYAARTASLDVTLGLQVAGVALLPDNFAPDMSRPPIWIDNHEISVFGIYQGRKVVLGIGGIHLSRQRIIVEEGSDGSLLDATMNSNGVIATAVAGSDRRLNVDVSNVLAPAQARRIATVSGNFDWAQLKWLTNADLALATHGVPTADHEVGKTTLPASVTSLYLIRVDSHPSIRRLEGITCPLSPLFFSPAGSLAVTQGAADVPPALIDLRRGTCIRLRSRTPVQILSWAPNSAAFLYRLAEPPGVYRFDIKTGEVTTISVSSGAAAYASDGAIIAVGSQELSWRRAVAQPLAPVGVQIAVFDPRENLKTINSLGFATQPALLSGTTMVLSPVTDDAIIETAILIGSVLEREIIEYSYSAHAAFLIAHGQVRGPISISWSPDGRQIAILDGNGTQHTVSIVKPPK
jgi:hypothetical protein